MERTQNNNYWQKENVLRPGDDDRLARVFIPRYTIPIVAGLAVAFPTEARKENIFSMTRRFSCFASFAVALNEAADIGVSADLRLLGGKVKQSQFVPLLQTRNFLFQELKRRRDNFVKSFPYLKETVHVIWDDFLLLSKNREYFNPVTFLELDSGIFEAGCMAVAFPNEDVLGRAEINFPGEACNHPKELLEKYEAFDLSGKDVLSSNPHKKAAQKLHALEMAMKVDDDIEGRHFDEQVGLPNYRLWAESVSKVSGEPVFVVLKRTKEEYLRLAGGNLSQDIINRSIALTCHLSGKLKDALGKNGIEPVNDLWQLPSLCRSFFKPDSTTLRHQLETSTLLNQIFSD